VNTSKILSNFSTKHYNTLREFYNEFKKAFQKPFTQNRLGDCYLLWAITHTRKHGRSFAYCAFSKPGTFLFRRTNQSAWARAQTSQVFTVQSFLVGKLGDYVFEGKAGVYAPHDYTEDLSGIVALSKKYNQEELVTAVLDYERLTGCGSHRIFDSRLSLANSIRVSFR